jgi:hypothetical protein
MGTSVDDDSDEEIDEECAFDSEDERKYGEAFSSSTKKNKKKTPTTADEDDGSDDDSDENDWAGSSDDYDREGADDDDDDDDCGGQYMLDLLKDLDASSSSGQDTALGEGGACWIPQRPPPPPSRYSHAPLHPSRRGITIELAVAVLSRRYWRKLN